jgi:hypothetical protein
MLQDVIAEGDLSIGGHHHVAIAPDANDGGGTNPKMSCRSGVAIESQENPPQAARCKVQNPLLCATLSIGHWGAG